jgi:hypothetical protein
MAAWRKSDALRPAGHYIRLFGARTLKISRGLDQSARRWCDGGRLPSLAVRKHLRWETSRKIVHLPLLAQRGAATANMDWVRSQKIIPSPPLAGRNAMPRFGCQYYVLIDIQPTADGLNA